MALTLMLVATFAFRIAQLTHPSTMAFVQRVPLRWAMRARLRTSQSRIARSVDMTKVRCSMAHTSEITIATTSAVPREESNSELSLTVDSKTSQSPTASLITVAAWRWKLLMADCLKM